MTKTDWQHIRFAGLFMLAALLLYAATQVLMEPLHTAGPMNISFEEPIGTLLIAVGISALGIAAWKRSAKPWTWSISLCALGAILLTVISVSVAHHPPREGQQDPSGLIPPTEYSMGLAYCMAYGLILVGIGIILKKGFKVINSARCDPKEPPTLPESK